MKTTLTIKQSAELIKRGVSACKASENYVGRWEHSSEGSFPDLDSVEPLFTLADLLSLLPKTIRVDNSPFDKELSMAFEYAEQKWYAGYCFLDDDFINHNIAFELIDALYNLLIWAIDHNHVKLD